MKTGETRAFKMKI